MIKTKVVNRKSLARQAVLISGGRLAVGGVQTHLRLLCKVLVEADAEVTVAATGSDWSAELIKEAQGWGVRFLLPSRLLIKSRYLSTLHSLITLPFHLRRQHFTALYCIGAGRSHQYLRKVVRPETVGIYHEIVSSPSPTSVEGQCAASLGAIIANSEKVGRDMAELWPEIPLRVIPFLTSDSPLPTPQPRAAVDSREMRVVYLGRLVAHKRPDQLVREWSHLSTLSPLSPARLDVFGLDQDSNMLHELRQCVVESGISKQVQLHGAYKIDELPQILTQADLVVLPSLWEGLPLVLVEAMQRGVPVVATDAGGTEELGKDNADVTITGTEWDSFVNGLLAMSQKLRSGQINSTRLYKWTESRYGYKTVSQKWQDALLNPKEFFLLHQKA